MSVADLERILAGDEGERNKLERIIRETRPTYSIGAAIAEEE